MPLLFVPRPLTQLLAAAFGELLLAAHQVVGAHSQRVMPLKVNLAHHALPRVRRATCCAGAWWGAGRDGGWHWGGENRPVKLPKMERVSGVMAGMNLQAPPSLAELRRLAPVLHRLTQSHGGEGLRVFGSVARGVAEADSDLDLLVDFPGSPSFEQFMDLKLALEDLLNVRVDLVTRKGLRAELRDRIEQEALPLA